jgi:hypothetical protein
VAVKATMRAEFWFVHPQAVVRDDHRMSAMKVTAREGWAVFDGTAQRGEGETLQVDADTADQWETAGWAEAVDKPSARTRRR